MSGDPQILGLTVNTADLLDRDIYVADASSPVTPRTIDDAHPAAATAAVALAQLHHHRLASDWESEMVGGVVRRTWVDTALVVLMKVGTITGYPFRQRPGTRKNAVIN